MTNDNDHGNNNSYLAGDVVETTYGVGVVVGISNEQHYRVFLWRIPGQSIASCAVAVLQHDSVKGKLPAAPGMTTTLCMDTQQQQQVMVHTYDSIHQYYLVERLNDGVFVKAKPHELSLAPSAKFYPLLEELMKRGDQTAAATSSLLNPTQLDSIVSKTNEITTTESSVVVSDLLLPQQEQVKQIYNMLRDEELTVLLEKGKERLQQLVHQDIPKATEEALLKTGITIVSNTDVDDEDSWGMRQSRQQALVALEQVLQSQNINVDELRDKLSQDFSTMFDSFQEAAQSDATLNSIFETVQTHTSEWQEASGRLLQTKSASLFLEASSRIQERAKQLFGSTNFDELTSTLTRAFTEGDAAVARLKSVEMGDAVRTRLVTLIEVRSGSHGGLDGIIAGALSRGGGGELQSMLSNLQSSASKATMDAKETLIGVLSNQSQYKHVALSRIEDVLVNLQESLGDTLSAEEIAALARGDGGTFSLFEPIAKKASTEIEKQLDAAEANIEDTTILEVLKRVRSILSGELTLSKLLDEAVSVLNDEKVVEAGATLVKHGEHVLDAIEGMEGNKMLETTLEVAEKAGITKDAVMKQMQSLNVNELLDTAQDAVTDEKARRQLLSSATDTALDFVLRILPSMPVPPFDGVKDGLVYHISNLSMKGFKVKKEDIIVEIAGMRATKKQKTPKNTIESGSDDNVVVVEESSSTEDDVLDTSYASATSVDISIQEMPSSGKVKATELLIIDVKNISAVLDDVVWSFEQTYMPYLKGSGKANVKLSDGAIRLQFELRRRLVVEAETEEMEWEPVLCLHDRSCSIGHIDLVMQGEGKLTWILNKLAAVFRGPLRDYVVRTILGVLTSQSGYILENLNGILTPYWGLVMRTANLSMEDLIEADEDVITAAVMDEDDNNVELVWRENLPLGMNLLLNDESGLLKVVDFPRGSQARAVCTERQVDPVVFNGATIVAVNGRRFDDREDLFDALRDPSRPKAIMFELANKADAERVKRFVRGSDDENEADPDKKNTSSMKINHVLFTENRELGIQFAPTQDDFGLYVHSYHNGPDGIVFEAEKKKIGIGHLLTHVNGEIVLGANGAGKEKALSLLETIGGDRPLELAFVEPYLIHSCFKKPPNSIVNLGGPDEFVFQEAEGLDGLKRVVLKDFVDASGMAEAGGVMIGDHLIFINAVPVGAGCRLVDEDHSPDLADVYEMLRTKESYPIGLTFARPTQQEGSRWISSGSSGFDVESAETICVTADSFEHLGCVLSEKDNGEIFVTDLFAVPGPIQLSMQKRLNLAIDSVNGQFVPSYSTPSIVMNALKRSWATNDSFEILFCDDARKEWVHGMLLTS